MMYINIYVANAGNGSLKALCSIVLSRRAKIAPLAFAMDAQGGATERRKVGR